MLCLFLFLLQTALSVLKPPMFLSLSDYFYFDKKDYHLRTVIFKSLNRLLPFNHTRNLSQNLVFTCEGFFVDQTTDHKSEYSHRDNAALISFEIDFRGKLNCQVKNKVSPEISTLLTVDYNINIRKLETRTQILAENDKFYCLADFSAEDPIITKFIFKGINQIKDKEVKEELESKFLKGFLSILKNYLKFALESDINKILDFQLTFPQPRVTQYLVPSNQVRFKNKRLEFDFFYSFFEKPSPYKISTGMPFTTNKNVIYLSTKGLTDSISSITDSFSSQFEISQASLGLEDKLLVKELEAFSDVAELDPEGTFKLQFRFNKVFSLEAKSEDSFLYAVPFFVEVCPEKQTDSLIRADGFIQLYLKMEVNQDKIRFEFNSHATKDIGKKTMEGIFETEDARRAFKKLVDDYLEIFISILNNRELVYLGIPISKSIKLENPRWIGADEGFAFQCDFDLY